METGALTLAHPDADGSHLFGPGQKSVTAYRIGANWYGAYDKQKLLQ
jgi:hypothetical protein